MIEFLDNLKNLELIVTNEGGKLSCVRADGMPLPLSFQAELSSEGTICIRHEGKPIFMSNIALPDGHTVHCALYHTME